MSGRTSIKKNGYRPEIDGLRTIVVMAVVIYHAEIISSGNKIIFSGGYLGVDIFFVISGYLITRILLREVAENRLSIVRFYERRIRRILPALFVVMFFSIVLGWLFMMPDAFTSFAGSGLSSLFFLTYSENLIRVLPRRLLCNQETHRCDLISKSDLLFSDETHVSPAGARIIVNEISRKLGLIQSDAK